jgi:hypothetical protein
MTGRDRGPADHRLGRSQGDLQGMTNKDRGTAGEILEAQMMHLEAPRCALRIPSQQPAPAQIPSAGLAIFCPSQRSHKMDATAGGMGSYL